MKDVAIRTGITDTRLSKMENDEDSPFIKHVEEYEALFNLYGMSDDFILMRFGRKEMAGVVRQISALDVMDRNFLYGVISLLANKKAVEEHTFRLGELFSGPGGLAWGAVHANLPGTDYRIVHAWANDFDESTCETYRRNICPDEPDTVICKDVRTLDIEGLSEIDALAFGFPCNDFSMVGEQRGLEGRYGALYTYGVRALKRFQPKWFLAENVSGLQSANDGNAFDLILQDLKDCGYRLYPHLYSFEEYGVPQSRHRVIIVGIRNDLPYEFRVPSPDSFKDVDVSCRHAIENPPIPEGVSNNEKTKQSDKVVARLSYIKPGQNAFNADMPDELRLNVKGAKISQIYRRLDPEKPAYTITGSGGGGTHVYHWSEPRALTNRERARLQTFPDDFEFKGSKEEVRKQIGMAVPCRGAQVIFEAILKTFAGIPYDSVDCNINIQERLTSTTVRKTKEKKRGRRK